MTVKELKQIIQTLPDNLEVGRRETFQNSTNFYGYNSVEIQVKEHKFILK